MDALTQSLVDNLNHELDTTSLDDAKPDPTLILVQVQGKPLFEFLEEDPTFQRLIVEGGSNPLVGIDQ